MFNSSQVSHFSLGAYYDTGLLRWLYFTIVLTAYVLIVLSNVLLIMTICLNRTLHEPMYILLCSLFMNELYGSTALFPMLLLEISRDVHTIAASFCFLQIFLIHSYATIEFVILAVISYDRYLSICFPLQYIVRMNARRVIILVSFPWFYSFVIVLILIFFSMPLKLCGHVIFKVYCNNYSIVKLACSDTSVNNIYGLLTAILAVFAPLIFILSTYVCILKVCFRGSKNTRQKALSTCTPHLASIINFSFGAFFEVVGSRFNLKSVGTMFRLLLSMYFLLVPPLFNPLMYGFKLTKVRDLCKKMLFPAPSHQRTQ